MCNPMIIMAVVAAYSSYSGREQEKYAYRQGKVNEEAGNASARSDAQRAYETLAARQLESEASTSIDVQSLRRETLQAQGSALAGQGGTAGLSTLSVVDDFERQKIAGIRNQNVQLGFERDQSRRDRESVEDRENAIRRQVFQQPLGKFDWINSILGVVGAGAAGYAASGGGGGGGGGKKG